MVAIPAHASIVRVARARSTTIPSITPPSTIAAISTHARVRGLARLAGTAVPSLASTSNKVRELKALTQNLKYAYPQVQVSGGNGLVPPPPEPFPDPEHPLVPIPLLLNSRLFVSARVDELPITTRKSHSFSYSNHDAAI